MFSFETELCALLLCMFCPGIEGGFDVEQEQYEEDVKVVILPDRQEVTSEDLATMPDVVRERVRSYVLFFGQFNLNIIFHSAVLGLKPETRHKRPLSYFACDSHNPKQDMSCRFS